MPYLTQDELNRLIRERDDALYRGDSWKVEYDWILRKMFEKKLEVGALKRREEELEETTERLWGEVRFWEQKFNGCAEELEECREDRFEKVVTLNRAVDFLQSENKQLVEQVQHLSHQKPLQCSEEIEDWRNICNQQMALIDAQQEEMDKLRETVRLQKALIDSQQEKLKELEEVVLLDEEALADCMDLFWGGWDVLCCDSE